MTLFVILLGIPIMLIGILFVQSSGKVKPFLNEDGTELRGSISEKIEVNINGVLQGMFIRGKDRKNPVLLFLHGGPGMPEFFLAEKYPTGIEDYFTVCYWEQRNAGISFSANIPIETLTVEQYVSDTIAVTNYLRERFGQGKIYLMAHSGGSFFGIKAAARAPELYNSYIGIGQISRQMESEKLAYTYMIEQYTASGNRKMVKRLNEYPIFDSDTAMKSYLTSLLRDDAMHALGIGTMRDMNSVITGIFLPVMSSQVYTVDEKINIWRGKAILKKAMWGKISETDLTVEIPKIEIPVYFMSGAYDYTTSMILAKSYLNKLDTPKKGFYTFDQSAHSPQFEEPEKFLSIMTEDVLNGKTSLADGK